MYPDAVMLWNRGSNSIRKELCTLFCLVKVYGLSGVYAQFLEFMFWVCVLTCKERSPAIIFFKTYPYTRTSRTATLLPAPTKGSRKCSLHSCTFCTIALSTKVRKCKSAKCKQYLTLHFEGWSGFNSSNSFSLLFYVGIFFSKAIGILVANLKCVDSYQIKGQDSRWRFDVFWYVLFTQSVKLAKWPT